MKYFEIRDSATCIPAFAFPVEGDCGLTRRAGYRSRCIMLGYLVGGKPANYDCFEWDNRTMQVAHEHIEDNWDSLVGGEVIDVEFILGETSVKKESECGGSN